MRERASRDDGFSIIEIVALIAVMAIVLVPVTDACIGAIRASSMTTDIAQIETILQNAADRVNRAPKACDYTVNAQAASQQVGWSKEQVVVTQKHFVPGANPKVPGTWAPGACVGSLPTELLVQLVTVKVTSPNGNVSRTIEVVKSDI
jgi:hypothetical protein